MLFQKISYRIALQFTAFVFALLILNGIIFLFADLQNARWQTGIRVARMEDMVRKSVEFTPTGFAVSLPAPLNDRIRVVKTSGEPVVSGMFFEAIPFEKKVGAFPMKIEGDHYIVMTKPIENHGNLLGYLQVAEMNRLSIEDLPERALIYLLISAAISMLTFFVGLFFARTSLQPAEKMVQKLEQFTQDAGHELRTPLATLSSSLDLALRTKKHEEGLKSAKEDVKEIANLVERLLEMARLEKFLLHTKEVNLSELARVVSGRHEAEAAKQNVNIETSIDENVTVQSEPGLLKQVLSNLITNAIKFSKPEGGNVTVKVTKKDCSVTDEGIGIPKESVDRIFDRFYQVESSRSRDGYGLGLSFVKQIVDLHGWKIDVKSKEGKGTTFTVSFSQNSSPEK